MEFGGEGAEGSFLVELVWRCEGVRHVGHFGWVGEREGSFSLVVMNARLESGESFDRFAQVDAAGYRYAGCNGIAVLVYCMYYRGPGRAMSRANLKFARPDSSVTAAHVRPEHPLILFVKCPLSIAPRLF